jgi:hypothetical protein
MATERIWEDNIKMDIPSSSGATGLSCGTHRAGHVVSAAKMADLVSAQGRQVEEPVRVKPQFEDSESGYLGQSAHRTHVGQSSVPWGVTPYSLLRRFGET